MLGPVLFVLYTVELISLIERHGLSPHLYADDTHVYGSCPPAAVDVDALSSQVTECADDTATWMKSNRLQLNPDKTEVLWCAYFLYLIMLNTSMEVNLFNYCCKNDTSKTASIN